MHRVRNMTDQTQKFWAPGEDGRLKLFRLAPGESVEASIDPDQPKFQGSTFSVTAKAVGPKPRPTRKPARKKAAASKKPAPPAQPASTEA